MDFHHIFHSRCVVFNKEMVDFLIKDEGENLCNFKEAREYNSYSFDPSLPPIFDEEIEEVTKRRVLPLKEESGQSLDIFFAEKFAYDEFTCAYKSPLELYINEKLYGGVFLNISYFYLNYMEDNNFYSCCKFRYDGTNLVLETLINKWHNDFERSKTDILEEYIEDDELKEYSNVYSNLLVLSFATSLFCELTRFVFDPGGFHSSKNRDDSF